MYGAEEFARDTANERMDHGSIARISVHRAACKRACEAPLIIRTVPLPAGEILSYKRWWNIFRVRPTGCRSPVLPMKIPALRPLRPIGLVVLAVWLGVSVAPTGLGAAPVRPAYLQLESLARAQGGEPTEINLRGTPLALATLLLDAQEKHWVRGVEQVQAASLRLEPRNRARAVQYVRQVAAQLGRAGWKRLTVAKNAQGQTVEMFTHRLVKTTADAVAVVVLDRGEEVVFVYATGLFQAADMSALAARLHIDTVRERLGG